MMIIIMKLFQTTMIYKMSSLRKYIPGHDSVPTLLPRQSLPPFLGMGSSQERFLLFWPYDGLQAPKDSHSPHPPFTKEEIHYTSLSFYEFVPKVYLFYYLHCSVMTYLFL